MLSQAADKSDQDTLSAALVDAIVATCPAYRPGTRPIHTSGIVATGWFSPTPVASRYTTAVHFAGPEVPVTVRFSNGTGDTDLPDNTPLVRGMAVRFHLGTKSTDLVAMTLPVFFSRDVAEFRTFLAATIPAPPTKRSWLRRLWALLHLETPYPSPQPGVATVDQAMYDYAVAHPEAEEAAAHLASKSIPASYTTLSYHAVHAFTLTGPDGADRSVRFHWEPVEGIWRAVKGTTGNFLREGLPDRIRNGRPEFVLRIQVAEQGDDTADPTRAWPTCRPRVVMGHLRLTDIVKDQYHGGELLGFNPTALVDGMALSDDPTLLVRGAVYPFSHARRLAAQAPATPPELPTSSNT